jgi:hypothetical protein
MAWVDVVLSAFVLVLAANILAVLVLGGASRQRREHERQ